MSYVCGSCGKVHEKLPQYFMWHIPELSVTGKMRLRYDKEFMCRIGHKRHFVRCELEMPFKAKKHEPLGFVGWVEISRDDYESYLAYRENENAARTFGTLMAGVLANPVPSVEGSLGTPVRFKVIKGDPTPYIKWVAPRTPLATRLKQGATAEFWHEVAATVSA
jgi:hypothetical protein